MHNDKNLTAILKKGVLAFLNSAVICHLSINIGKVLSSECRSSNHSFKLSIVVKLHEKVSGYAGKYERDMFLEGYIWNLL